MRSAMPLPCQYCRIPYSGKVARTLLAFPAFTCPDCGHVNVYPLGNGYRRLYQILAVVFGISFIGGLSTGYMVLPGGLVVIALVALTKNHKLMQHFSAPTHFGAGPGPEKSTVIAGATGALGRIETWHAGQLAIFWVAMVSAAILLHLATYYLVPRSIGEWDIIDCVAFAQYNCHAGSHPVGDAMQWVARLTVFLVVPIMLLRVTWIWFGGAKRRLAQST